MEKLASMVAFVNEQIRFHENCIKKYGVNPYRAKKRDGFCV
jgi:hypothetical protein